MPPNSIMAKMDADQFRGLVVTLYEKRPERSLNKAYADAELMHEYLLGCERYPGGFEAFRQEYYRKHPTRQEKPNEP